MLKFSYKPASSADDTEIEAALVKIMEERQELRIREEEIKLREQAMREKEAIENEIKKLRSKEIRASQVGDWLCYSVTTAVY